ncbi:hypothetical protein OAA27_02545, partial [bacterium]|nr:hypothetical protein [bacterium]
QRWTNGKRISVHDLEIGQLPQQTRNHLAKSTTIIFFETNPVGVPDVANQPCWVTRQAIKPLHGESKLAK